LTCNRVVNSTLAEAIQIWGGSLFDSDSTQQSELRGGTSPWLAKSPRHRHPSIQESCRCDVLVVGAGITGSLVTEHLTSLGYQVITLDRERPGFGSTAASTSMLQWEIDCSLGELTGFYGFERAANIYHRSLQAVAGLGSLISDLRLDCAYRNRNSLYLAAGDIGGLELRQEHALRERAQLPGIYLDHPSLLREFGFTREGAIFSPGSADADPLQLSRALLASAVERGATVYDAQALGYDVAGSSVGVTLESGHVIEARHVVLATGYVMPNFVKSDIYKTASSWAIATPPQNEGQLWRDGALIWEASTDYLYARTTSDLRIVIGGEDDDTIVEPEDRDRLMPAKAERILAKLKQLWPIANAQAEFIWSGAFGQTEDGLPLIGPVPGHPRILAAYGYGGNGITFSYLASRLVGGMIGGQSEPWFEEFAIDRPAPAI